ncbi:hypothetical protein J1614_002689 [Plenodomus biglobosus]|nr:hypothetical protein J1614_002689 [Plenodomus biglobosus]
MTLNIPDHYLWLGLGVFTFFAINSVSHGLQNILHLTTIHNSTSAPPSSALPPHPTHQEDSIDPSSLLLLATSHITELRDSATRILCTRFYANKAARRALLRDLKSADEDTKRKAHLALNMLCELGIWKEGQLDRIESRAARWRLVGNVERDGQERGVGAEEREREVRRRRREAVVIHDGEGAIGSQDVYMRGGEAGSADAEALESFITSLAVGGVDVSDG